MNRKKHPEEPDDARRKTVCKKKGKTGGESQKKLIFLSLKVVPTKFETSLIGTTQKAICVFATFFCTASYNAFSFCL